MNDRAVQRSRWYVWVTIGALVVVGLVAGWLRMRANRGGGLGERRTYRGAPDHLLRIQAIKSAAGRGTVETLIEELFSDDQCYYYPGVNSPRKFAQLDLLQCLSVRRNVRLWQLVGDMPEAERAQVLKRLGARTLEEQKATFERVLRSFIDPGAPKNTQSVLANTMAICVFWWMAAHYQEVEDLLAHMRELESYRGDVESRIAKDTRVPEGLQQFPFGRVYFPDNACKLNVLVVAIERHPRASRKQLQSLHHCLKQLRKNQLILTAWDAETTSFDFTHVIEGVPIDKSKGTFEYTIYDWDSGQLMDDEFQRQVISEVEQIAAAVASGHS